MKSFSRIGLAAFAFLPAFAFAQDLGGLARLVTAIGRLVDLATPIVVGLALLAFFWGLVKFIFNAGSEDNKQAGIRLMVSGIIAIFVIVSLMGIVRWIGNSLGVTEQGGTIPVPNVEGL